MRATTHRLISAGQCVTAATMAFGLEANLQANPTGLSVQSGTASAANSGSKLTVTTSKTAVLNWQSFNIGAGETTIFNQPSAGSVVFNQIGGQSASQIYGSLQANGTVVLINSSGFYFGPNSFVSTAGLIVSTAKIAPLENSGGAWEFDGPAPEAGIINYGRINVGKGGSAYLIAENVQNNGTINAPAGSIGLIGGQDVLLSERPDGRGLSVKVNVPAGTVDNEGFLRANGGNISLEAQAVNQGGVVQANSVKNDNGVIELVAADNLTLAASSQISANGDDSTGGSAGGSITLKSGNMFSDTTGSQVSATGGAQGGNGGSVEISAPSMSSLNSRLNAAAQPGYAAGKLSLDPDYIILDTSGPDSAGSGTVLAGDNPGDTLDLNVNSAFSGFSQINLQANYDITLADGTFWNLSGSTGQSGGTLTLEAGRNIIFGNTTGIYDANNWSVALYAGVGTFSLSQPVVTPGAGSIYLNAYDPNNPNNNISDPSGFIQLASGNISLEAGQDVIVGEGVINQTGPDGYYLNAGSITTTGGGSINVHALAGNIDTGGTAQGYNLGNTGIGNYDLSDGLGGISTAAGGDVTLIAGGNVESVLPGNGRYDYDGSSVSISAPNSTAVNGNDYITAGVGAYGNQSGQSGNVTIVAGGSVTGHYLVANGMGRIFAGVKMDASGNPVTDSLGNYVLGGNGSAGTDLSNPDLALSLVKGGWNVSAANNIVLQEVNNPSGDFDLTGGSADHYFDYGLSDYVNLNAGNEVELGTSSGNLARLTSQDNIQVPVIYPPILAVTAGAGGINLNGDGSVLNDELILFPSPQGQLSIQTTHGGSLIGNQTLNAGGATPKLFNLIVSDSGRQQYNSSSGGFFGLNDHAATPVHYGSETPIDLNIAGNLDDLLLGFPEAAQINVGGNMNTCGYQGMNLAANDVTSINVLGNISNPSSFTSVDLSQVAGAQTPDLSMLSLATSSNPSGSTLASSFFYNTSTHLFTYANIPGQKLASVLNLLENLQIFVTENGVIKYADAPTDSMPETTTVSAINAADAQALLNEYNTLGPVPASVPGYVVGGGGKFNVSAHNLELGTSPGIQSVGVSLYQVAGKYPLAKYFTTGADVTVNLTGDLTMFSSSIASLNGGDVYVNADGSINVGSADFVVNSTATRGIYGTDGANVAVYAGGDINVDGSRIASYDLQFPGPNETQGGALTIVSRDGSIDAGSGGSGSVVVNSYTVNSVNGANNVTFQQETIPGNGILSTAFTPLPGNILVEAPNGSITAGNTGISQLALLHNLGPGGSIYTEQPDLPALDEMFNLDILGNAQQVVNIERQLNGVAGNIYLSAYTGYELQPPVGSGVPLLDQYGNPSITASDLADGTLVRITSATVSPSDENINSTGSGIVGAGSVSLASAGTVKGSIFALGNVDISALNNVVANVLGLGMVNVVSQNGSIEGTIVGINGVSADASSISADLESNGSVSGATTGATGLAAGTGANSVSAAASSDLSTKNTTQTAAATDDDQKKKKGKTIGLAQKVSRVTVLLP